MVSPDRITAMHDAITQGDLGKVKLLLKAGVPADGGSTIPFICLAASLGNGAIFDLLVEHGAPMETPELLEYAVDGGGGRILPALSTVKKLLESCTYDKDTLDRSLRFASVSGSPEVVRILMEHGADPNGVEPDKMDYPLSNAIRHGRAAVIAELLKHGANPKVMVFEENHLGEKLDTQVSLAELALNLGFPDIAELLGD